MARQPSIAIQNNFTGGLKTEFTGLNFPENACIETFNCVFNRTGRVTRRLGIDYEANKTLTAINRASVAISEFKWTNAGGDSTVNVSVLQVGGTLHFYRYSSATTSSPISAQKLASTITLSTYTPSGGGSPNAVECQYSAGNGYLFVYHPLLEPFYCTYSAGTITATQITVNIRDFEGIVENGVEDTFRSNTLTSAHQYNLQNQGWTNVAGWSATSTTSNNTNTGSHTWTVQTGLSISGGQVVNIVAAPIVGPGQNFAIYLSGSVTSYTSGTGVLVINVTSTSYAGATRTNWTFTSYGTSKITTWNTALGNYPSNSDVWWYFKNTSNVFDPTNTVNNVTLNAGPAPKGFYILDAFNQSRTAVSSVTGLTDVTTTIRPKTGTWFQGRVWYAGVDVSGFTENIYFSQIVERSDQFGKCYQTNDPTSEDRFDILPSDGGLIRIQGMGSVNELFPVQNGLLVFANGIWFITGNQGLGFTATDYTVTKISSVQSISGTSFVDVRGYPVWWNEEGIFGIFPNPQGGLEVKSLTEDSISSFYEDIPLTSKRYARGDYNPITYTLQWTYRNTEESSVTTRYEFDRILTLDTSIKAFSPWTVSGTPKIHGVSYIAGPGGSTSPAPVFKYLTSVVNGGSYDFTFSEARDTNYGDWDSPGTIVDYSSYFITGPSVKQGNAQNFFQSNYLYLFSDGDAETSYEVQGIFQFANTGDTGHFSPQERATLTTTGYDVLYRRHKIRGKGIAKQFKVVSVTGEPFSIIGWSQWDTVNMRV